MFRSVFTGAMMLSMLSFPVLGGASFGDERYDVAIRDQNVRDVFQEISAAVGVPILLSDSVDGRVSASFEQATAVEMLDGIAKDRALDWRFDGSRIRVSAQSEQVTRIIDLDGVMLGELSGALKSLDVYNDRFQMSAVDGAFAMVVAPPDYVALVEVVLGALAERRTEERMAKEKSDRERLEFERRAFEQKLEFDRLEREAALERMKMEHDRMRAWQRNQYFNQRRGPTVVRNGVWGG